MIMPVPCLVRKIEAGTGEDAATIIVSRHLLFLIFTFCINFPLNTYIPQLNPALITFMRII
jgi:hypothetical protein